MPSDNILLSSHVLVNRFCEKRKRLYVQTAPAPGTATASPSSEPRVPVLPRAQRRRPEHKASPKRPRFLYRARLVQAGAKGQERKTRRARPSYEIPPSGPRLQHQHQGRGPAPSPPALPARQLGTASRARLNEMDAGGGDSDPAQIGGANQRLGARR